MFLLAIQGFYAEDGWHKYGLLYTKCDHVMDSWERKIARLNELYVRYTY